MPFITALPRTFLRNWLVDREAVPLEPSWRAFIQQRFGVNVDNVRVHRGPAASRLCALLQARALVVNRDIVFSEGQYAPDTPAGQRILAHEIIHLLQQQHGKAPHSEIIPVGDPHDQHELEADRLAEDALGGNLRITPTPDSSGAIRRVFTVAKDATMVAKYDGAIPGVSYRNSSERMALFHLTRHSAPILAGAMRKAADASAIRITASVGVLTNDPKADLASSDLNFHFLQFFGLTDQRAFYAGPVSSDGNMFLDFASSPAFSGADDLMLDSESKSTIFPFYDQSPPEIRRVHPALWSVRITTDDHPFHELPLRLPNFAASDKFNYLCSAYKRFNVVTAFVVRDYSNVSKPVTTILAEMFWGAEVACKFRWSHAANGNLEVGPAEFTTRDFHCGEAITDRDPDLAARIADLSDATGTFNDAAVAAYKTVVGSTFITRNTQASDKWYSSKVAEAFK
jgi:hypothetical protein